MTAVLFQYPDRSTFDKEIPKARILAGARSRRGLRDRLSAELADIVWACKLAPVSLNLPAGHDVAEIQIFRLRLKPGVADVSESVLRAMDQAIPSPILFEIQGESGIRVAGAYKRPNEADAGKYVLSDYLRGDWVPTDTPRQPLPVALDMAGLYRELLRVLIPLPPRASAFVWKTNCMPRVNSTARWSSIACCARRAVFCSKCAPRIPAENHQP